MSAVAVPAKAGPTCTGETDLDPRLCRPGYGGPQDAEVGPTSATKSRGMKNGSMKVINLNAPIDKCSRWLKLTNTAVKARGFHVSSCP